MSVAPLLPFESPGRGEDDPSDVQHTQVLQKQIQFLEDDLVAARAVQRFMLPPETLDTPRYHIAHLYQPLHHIGGDYVDLRQREDGSVVTFVGDITGHGVPAAMTFAMLKLAFLRHADVEDPAQLLTLVGRELAERLPDGTFVTALAQVFNRDGTCVRIASAGHPQPLLVRGSEVTLIRTEPAFPLLVAPELDYTEQLAVDLRSGDHVIALTDGTLEAREVDRARAAGTESSADALLAAIRANAGRRGNDLLRSVYESLFFGDFVFRDDVTLLSVAVR